VRADVEQHRVTATRQQAEERRLERLRLEIERGDVAVEVVDGDERQPTRPRNRFCCGEADKKRADQPRPAGDRDTVDVPKARVRLNERLADHRRHELEVPPRRDFRHDAAVARVQLRLRRDDARADLALVGDERSGGLVAARLDPENQRATGSFHMISASSRLSV
jgi:hypothetical protein